MRKLTSGLLSLVFFLVFAASLALSEKSNISNIISKPQGEDALHQDEIVVAELEEIPKSTKRTIMVYLCGSNLEEVGAAASRDILEMIRSGFSTESVNVLVMTGGARRWALPLISSEWSGIYQIGNDGLRCVSHEGRHYNMGDPETLRGFMEYAYANYPADQYALILWDHGGGSIGGICHDMIYDDFLSMPELDKALKESPLADKKLSWIGFDACMMGSCEVAGTVFPYADYMIASEEVEPGIGWDYAFLGQMKDEEKAEDICIRIVELYINSCKTAAELTGSSAMYTMSCVDLTKFNEFCQSMGKFFSAVNIGGENFIKASKARRSITAFGRNEETPEQDYDLIDLGDMINKLSSYGDQEKANQALKELGECVVLSRTTREDRNSTGLTVYFPYYNKLLYRMSREYYGTLSVSDDYSAAVYSFGDELLRSMDDQMGPVNNVQIGDGRRDNRTIVQLKLKEDQAELADLAEIIALQKTGQDDGWRLVATQHAGINEAGMASGEYVHTNLFVTDENGNPLYDEPLLYVERDDGLYSVPVILTDANQKETEARLICKRELGAYLLSVVDVYLYDEVTESYSSRFSGNLTDYVSASYVIEEKKPSFYNDQDGSPLRPFDQWETVKTIKRSWDLTGEWRLNFVRDYLDIETISVLFRITDVYNNVYLSAPVPITGDEKTIQLTYDDNQRVLINQESVNLTPNGMLFMRAQNVGTQEAKMWVSDLQVNGTERESDVEIMGFGENEGLDPEEEQLVILDLQLAEEETVQELSFNIYVQNIGEDDAEKIGIQIGVGTGIW